jgi:hypothetical protein
VPSCSARSRDPSREAASVSLAALLDEVLRGFGEPNGATPTTPRAEGLGTPRVAGQRTQAEAISYMWSLPPAVGGRSVPSWGFPPDRRGTLLAANRVRTARVGVRQRFASGFARGLAVRIASSQSAFQAQLGPPIRIETLFALKHSWGSDPTGLPYAITLPTP